MMPVERGGDARHSSRGSSFHFSFGLLRRDRRKGIEAVYAFCRVIDDVIDDIANEIPGESLAASGRNERAAEDLRRFRQEIALCYGGRPTRLVTRDLQDSIDRFGIPREPFEDLLDGVEMDLARTRYESFEDLRGYCYRVASTVGLICTSIFGCQHPASRDYAIDLGIALQLTNILRDLKTDAERGRIYIPLDEIRSFGYSEEALLAGERTPAFLELMRHQMRRADEHFDRAARALPDADRPRLLAAEVMGAIYRRLLRRIESGGFRVFDGRITVPRLQQLGLALRAWVTGSVGD
jgi:phytoene synthase